MKKTIVVLILALSMTAGFASASTSQKIAVVDLQRAVSECKEGISARADLLKKTEEYNAELKLIKAEYEKLQAELEKDAAKMSIDDRTEKEKLIQKKGRNFQNRQREAQEEIKQLETEHLKKVVNRLGAIMTKIGDEGNYSAVLDRNTGVYYTNKEIDLTSMLVKRADEEFGAK